SCAAQCASTTVDGDVDRDTVGEYVEDRGAVARLLNDLAQLLWRGVARDIEADADTLVAIAHLVRQPQDAAEVDVAFDARLHRRESDPTNGRNVADACCNARREPVQKEFDRGGPAVLPHQHGGMIGVVSKLRLVRVFSTR